MRGLTGIGPLVWERLIANWRMLAVLTFGILTAATLLALSPIYTRVMNDLGLDVSLEEHLRSSSRNTLFQFRLPLGSEEQASRARDMLRMMASRTSWFTGSEVRFAALPDLTMAQEGEAISNDRFRTVLTLQTMSGIADHVTLTEGRLPGETQNPANIEVALPLPAAEFLRLHTGDSFLAAVPFDDCNRPPPTDDPQELRERARFPCVPQVHLTANARLTVVGIFDQRDAEDPFWSAGRLSFASPAATDTMGAIVPVVLSEGGFFKALPQVFPGIPTEFRVTSFADVDRLDSTNLDKARSDLVALRQQATEAGLIADLSMASALDSFNRRATFNQVSLLLLLLQVVGIALYYVVLVSSLLVEGRSEEIAMLRSRGASTWQVVSASAIEAALLATGAALVAPFLAAGAIAGLGKSATFKSVSGGHFLPYVIEPQAFLLAAAGAGLAVAAVLIPTVIAARRGMLDYLHGAARPSKPFFQRYYLDFALAGLAAFAVWELSQKGSVFDPHSIGGWSADPLLLVTPMLLILAIGALIFRLLPLALGAASRVVSLTAGPGTTLGLWQVTRSPSRYSQLALLVIMAASVGTFAATYGETTDRSQEDRALFEAGVDARTASLARLKGDTPAEIQQELVQVPGVSESATAFRGTLGATATGNGIPVLAVDTQKAQDLLYFRKDFAGQDLSALLRQIQGSPTGGTGLPLPGEPLSVSVWVNPTQERDTTTMWLRTRDADGVFHLDEFGVLDFSGYRKMTARLVTELETVRYPVSIVGILLTQPSGMTDNGRGSVLVDDISVADATGQETIVEDFDGPLKWDAFRVPGRSRDVLKEVNQGQRRGTGAAQFLFQTGSSLPVRGFYVADANVPLPAIASQRFLNNTGTRVGSEIEMQVGSIIAPVSIRAVTDLFPTMDDSGNGFLIVNQDHLYFFQALAYQNSALSPNEIWFRLPDDPTERAAAKQAISDRFNIPVPEIVDVQDVLTRVKSDPVVRAGGSGILLLAVVASFAILALGFALTLYTGGQARTVEVAVMRAMGFSRRQIFSMVSLEYVIVAVVGIVVGTIAGLRISVTMLSFLNVTESGARVVPPFALATQWGTVGLSFLVIAFAFALGILALVLYFLRLPMTRFLRLTR